MISDKHFSQIYPFVSEAVGVGGIFFIISVINVFGAIFSRFAIPQTRNKTISELDQLFVRGKNEKYGAFDNPIQQIDETVFD